MRVAFTHTCVRPRMLTWKRLLERACACMRAHVFLRLHLNALVHLSTRESDCACIPLACACMRARVRANACAHAMNACMHARTHACTACVRSAVRLFACSCVCAFMCWCTWLCKHAFGHDPADICIRAHNSRPEALACVSPAVGAGLEPVLSCAQ